MNRQKWLFCVLNELLPLCCMSGKTTTAANCCSRVKYGQTAWWISLPLITKAWKGKEKALYFHCVRFLFIHPHRWYCQRCTEQLSHCCPISPRFLWAFCDSIDIELSFTFSRHIRWGWMDGQMDRWPQSWKQRSYLEKQKAVFLEADRNWWL